MKRVKGEREEETRRKGGTGEGQVREGEKQWRILRQKERKERTWRKRALLYMQDSQVAMQNNNFFIVYLFNFVLPPFKGHHYIYFGE